MTPRKNQLPPLLEALVNPDLEGAACAGRAPWFDDAIDGESDEDRADRLDAARRVCRGCPVRAACHSAAAEHVSTGVWAGRLRETPEKFTTRKAIA
ncbi:WhiB family transcriptional regulator [Rhodococcus sp. NPDC127530]|uniref:WhiB family transcriptional regulator n=1 Tax=unclassified Rhodococcus (in: high G+C Gram-positive bacteria) TaxID=192944 RepID=UPI003628B5B5